MQFIMFVCAELPFRPENPEQLANDTEKWGDEMERRGLVKTGSRLASYTEAKTVCIRDNQPQIKPGPFEETKHRIAGFDILECASMDEAVEVALRHPMAAHGLIEVRQMRD